MVTDTVVPSGPASAESMCLPAGYRQQAVSFTLDSNRDNGAYWSAWRIAENAKWQHHVYTWAARLIKDSGARRVLDVGCGVGVKLTRHLGPTGAALHAVDQASALEVARRLGAPATLTEVNLERPTFNPGHAFDLIVCADVIEHLLDPRPMLAMIRSVSHPGTRVLFSTPERSRERGRACMSSDKPEHVREWSREEFRRFLVQEGFPPLRSRLMPKDDAPVRDRWAAELEWRLGRAEKSPMCCQAWVCSVEQAAQREAA